MPLNFPSSPTNGQTFTDGDKVYVWDATAGVWNKTFSGASDYVANSLVAAPNGVASLDSAGQVPASQLGNASGGAMGGGTDEVFYENAQTVTTNYTITSSRNALSAGPITIGTGVTVTVPSGSVWAIV